MSWLFGIGFVVCFVGLVGTIYLGALIAIAEGNLKSRKVIACLGFSLCGIALVIVQGQLARRDLAELKERRDRIDAARAEAHAEFEKAKDAGEKKKLELKQWGSVLEGMLKDQPVPPGNSRLCYVSTPDVESGKFESVSIFTRHLTEKKVVRAEEVRGAEKVIVWSNLDAAFAKEWLQLFEKAGVRAWVEEAAGK